MKLVPKAKNVTRTISPDSVSHARWVWTNIGARQKHVIGRRRNNARMFACRARHVWPTNCRRQFRSQCDVSGKHDVENNLVWDLRAISETGQGQAKRWRRSSRGRGTHVGRGSAITVSVGHVRLNPTGCHHRPSVRTDPPPRAVCPPGRHRELGGRALQIARLPTGPIFVQGLRPRRVEIIGILFRPGINQDKWPTWHVIPRASKNLHLSTPQVQCDLVVPSAPAPGVVVLHPGAMLTSML